MGNVGLDIVLEIAGNVVAQVNDDLKIMVINRH